MTDSILNPIIDIAQQAKPILTEVFQDSSAHKKAYHSWMEDLYQDAQKCTLRTLVFGYYNAGKSTLINALLGKERAKMGQGAVTDTVTPYDWKGFELWDSPGIDAPIAHEQVTREVLARCHAVIFVLPVGGIIEEQATLEELCQLKKAGKHVMIVANNIGTEIEADSMAYLQFQDQVMTNLQQAADTQNIDGITDKIAIHYVNAKMALNGKLKHKPGLLEKSGITLLERHLQDFFKQQNAIIVHSHRQQLRNYLNLAQIQLAQQDGQIMRRSFLDVRNQIDQQQQHMRLQFENILADTFAQEKNKLAQQIGICLRSGQVDTLTETIETALQKALNRINSRLESELNAYVEQLRTQLSAIDTQLLKELDIAFNQGKITQDELLIMTQRDIQNRPENMTDILTESLKNLPDDVLQQHIEEGTLFVLKKAKEWLPAIFKNMNGKTLDVWSKTLGRYAVPVFSLVVQLMEFRSIKQQEEEEKRRVAREVSAIMAQVALVMDDYRTQFQQLCQDYQQQIFRPLFSNIDTILAELKKTEDKHTLQHTQLQQWLSSLETL